MERTPKMRHDLVTFYCHCSGPFVAIEFNFDEPILRVRSASTPASRECWGEKFCASEISTGGEKIKHKLQMVAAALAQRDHDVGLVGLPLGKALVPPA